MKTLIRYGKVINDSRRLAKPVAMLHTDFAQLVELVDTQP